VDGGGEWRQELNAGTRQAQRRPRRLRDRLWTWRLPTPTRDLQRTTVVHSSLEELRRQRDPVSELLVEASSKVPYDSL
jgi:hypothetical protein